MPMVRWVGAGLFELLSPRRCAGCDQIARDLRGPFCSACTTSIEPHPGVGAAFEYGGAVAEAIRRFKYEGRSELGVPLGLALAEAAKVFVGNVELVVPVPLHWRRRRQRGYDQAALLSGPVGRALAVPVGYRALLRIRDTPRQAELSAAARAANVEGAFRSRRALDARTVLLVDDVRTTGATLGSAEGALKRAGVTQVRSLVLAARVLERTT